VSEKAFHFGEVGAWSRKVSGSFRSELLEGTDSQESPDVDAVRKAGAPDGRQNMIRSRGIVAENDRCVLPDEEGTEVYQL